MSVTDQLAFRNRLYNELPAEWFPPVDEAPNLAAILDMLASVWTTEQVVNRMVQFDVSSNIMLLDGTFVVPIGSTMTGPGIVGNPVVTRAFTETIGGQTFQTVQTSIAQVIPAGTILSFGIPDKNQNGLIQSLDFVKSQNRLQTSTGSWLDLFGQDFFGQLQQRHISESDNSYRRRLLYNVMSPKVSRCALACGVTNLTGFAPRIIELRNTNDCGSYASLDNVAWGGLAYSKAGAYGSMELPFQLFINCTRPNGEGIPNISGYSSSTFGYATVPLPFGYVGATFPANYGTGSYVQLSDLDNRVAVTDADIYQQIAGSVAAGVTAWTSITSDIESEIRSGGLLDINFFLDLTTLAHSAALPGQLFGTGSIAISASAVLVHNVLAASGTLRLGSSGALDNPIYAQATVTAFAISTEAGFGSDITRVLGSFALTAASTITSVQTAIGVGRLSLSTSSATVGHVNAVALPGPINISATAMALQQSNITITRFSTTSLLINGSSQLTFLSVNFSVGTSQLIPPGGRLGQTVLLGYSKVGFDYGY